MTQPIGHTGVTHEDLQCYFDDELTGAEAQELAAQIEAEPVLKRELEQLAFLRASVREGLMAQADAIPAARFEQIWDEIDRAIERDVRDSKAGSPTPSLWTRLRGAVVPLRVPILAAAALAAVAIVAVRSGSFTVDSSTPGSRLNGPEALPSVAEHSAPEVVSPKLAPTVPVPPPAPDDALALEFPEPKATDAEIHRVEFGGRSGRIAKTGTVTVLYVEEDVEPKDSERSL